MSRLAARRAVPVHPRRVSGPVARPVPVPGRPRPNTPIAVPHSAFGATLRALPDHRLLDGLLRSRAWIWLLGVALGGIVFMQVSLLQMNNGIGNAVAQSTQMEHANALLSQEVAELSSGARIEEAAAAAGLISPDAGDVGFVSSRGGVDARRAAETMTAPSDEARAIIATNGKPAEVVAPAVVAAAPTTTEAPVEPVVTEVPTVAPVETVEPVVTTAPPPTDPAAVATGAAAAPTG